MQYVRRVIVVPQGYGSNINLHKLATPNPNNPKAASLAAAGPFSRDNNLREVVYMDILQGMISGKKVMDMLGVDEAELTYLVQNNKLDCFEDGRRIEPATGRPVSGLPGSIGVINTAPPSYYSSGLAYGQQHCDEPPFVERVRHCMFYRTGVEKLKKSLPSHTATKESRWNPKGDRFWWNGREWLMSPQRKRIIKVLHDHRCNGGESLKLKNIQELADMGTFFMTDHFKPDDDNEWWEGLIQKFQHGHYGLIPEAESENE